MYQSPRGTFDIYNEEYNLRKTIINTLFSITEKYGFNNIETPIFEDVSLFVRTVGETSDIVNKEIYEFSDKKGRSLALRPELTAPIMRSYIQNKMYAQNPIKKFAYYGPAFRYERPQAGRFRQFYQFGIESFGIKNPVYDAQIIAMAKEILDFLNINNYKIFINTIGSQEDRKKYNEALKTYFHQYQDDLCSDCLKRLSKNPLRILDCKHDNQKEFFKQIPKLENYLSQNSKKYFDDIKKALNDLEINYEVDENLVRGLDYYNDIVFEIKMNTNNAKDTVIGGGRYDYLASTLEGPFVESIGFAIGVERLIDLFKQENEISINDYKLKYDIFLGAINDEDILKINKLLISLRNLGFICETNYEKQSYKSCLKQSLKNEAIFLITIKEEKFILKNLIEKTEKELTDMEIIDYFKEMHE